MKKLRQPAIVLQTIPVRESDLIVTLLGKESGRITVSAKGARKSKKRFLGGIDVFDCGTFELEPTNKPDRLFTLSAIHNREVWPGLREKLVRLSLASFCLEITCSFSVEGDPEGGTLFNPLFLSLRTLSESEDDNQLYTIAAYFSLLVLKVSGFDILHSDAPLDEQVRAWFEEMLALETPIAPHEYEITRKGLAQLVSFTEQTLGHRLKTSGSVLKDLL